MNISPWQSDTGCLCPLATGALIADLIDTVDSNQSIQLAGTAFPLLMAAIVIRVVPQIDESVGFRWLNVQIVCANNGFAIIGDRNDLMASGVNEVTVEAQVASELTDCPVARSVHIDSVCWEQLNDFAFRTYVPSHEASRAGAGSALSDND